ncbi:membrane-associated protein, putative [Bodo saltans]|uniref:Membrane-associated protein, putative n=1 Tax=Bodo saltans TaxID=75058 RepID=A0A0S4J1B2_BODSA|nr:membrane-associated protein, putative [Bodo saltans]|eukprot:CUG43198.1 membrane-associated protein, putative [Bodo saltans]
MWALIVILVWLLLVVFPVESLFSSLSSIVALSNTQRERAKRKVASDMSYKPPIGDPDLLKKRLITNPKFDHVKSSVECGINGNLARLIRTAEPSIKQGQNEKFRRIRASQIAQSLEETYLEIRMREFNMGGVDDEVDRFIAHQQRQQQQLKIHELRHEAAPPLTGERPLQRAVRCILPPRPTSRRALRLASLVPNPTAHGNSVAISSTKKKGGRHNET